MRFVFIFLIAFCLVWFLFPRKKGEGESAEATLREIALDTVDGADCIVLDGARYYAYQGEDVDGTQLWTWHGRMGEQVGVLFRENSPLPVGELYQLRGENGEILLAYLPSDGWPVTDMELFLREGAYLPEVRTDGFAFGEIYRIEGEYSEEEWEMVGEITEPSHLRTLAEAWLRGESFDLPRGEYRRYRVRLYWGERPGLYVTFGVNVLEERGVFAAETFGFRGDALLPASVFDLFR